MNMNINMNINMNMNININRSSLYKAKKYSNWSLTLQNTVITGNCGPCRSWAIPTLKPRPPPPSGSRLGFPPTDTHNAWKGKSQVTYHAIEKLKGTVSRDSLLGVFFIKELLLEPLDMPREDFDFFSMFEELSVFVIHPPMYSPPGVEQVYSLPWGRDSPVYFSTLGHVNMFEKTALPKRF
jgi:hypothetical protein